MRKGPKALSIILITGVCSLPWYAHSSDLQRTNISNKIEFTLNRMESQSDACKAERRSVGNNCGQSYIYPVLSNHPDSTIGTKINEFIQLLEVQVSNDLSRVESWTEVTLNQHNILSLSYTGQSYSRSAVADQSIKVCTNIDLASGEKMTLTNVLKQEYEKQIPRLVFENLETKLKNRLPGYMLSLLEQKGADWTLNSDQPFFLRKQGITLCFDPGALSNETVGPVALPLPYALISDLIDESGPLAFALNQPLRPLETNVEAESLSIEPPVNEETRATPQPDEQTHPAKFQNEGSRVGSVDHICFKESVTHKISVVEYQAESPFICIVEYDKGHEQKVLWRSRKTKSFCHEKTAKLITKYEGQWGYTCGQSSTLPES